MLLTPQTPNAHYYDVYLNGAKQDMLLVREANEEAGYVQFIDAVCTDSGSFRLQRDSAGEIRTFMLRGVVVCVLREDCPVLIEEGTHKNGQKYQIWTNVSA